MIDRYIAAKEELRPDSRLVQLTGPQLMISFPNVQIFKYQNIHISKYPNIHTLERNFLFQAGRADEALVDDLMSILKVFKYCLIIQTSPLSITRDF